MSENGNRILCLTFNHFNTLLYVGTSQGLRVFRLEDFKIISRRDRMNSINFLGGFKSITPLYDNQKIALVGTRINPRFKENTLVVWDEYQASTLKSLEFASEIKKVMIRRECLAVVLENHVINIQTLVYSINSWDNLACIDTAVNNNGAGAISQVGSLILLVLGAEPGQIKIENLTNRTYLCTNMHANPILCLNISDTGNIGASSSEYGTVIRVFSCETLTVLHELRRGTISARISSLVFSKDAGFLIAASNKATVHIWNLDILSAPQSSWLLPSYFQYQRSYFKVRIQPEINWTSEFTSQCGPSLCITEENLLYVAHLDGNIYAYEINNEPVLRKTVSYMDFEEDFIEDEHQWTSLE